MAQTIGIIGVGSMGEQLGRMILRHHKQKTLIGSVRNYSRKDNINKLFGTTFTMLDNKEIAKKSDVIILSTKPTQIRDVCKEITQHVNPDTPIISAAAAVPLTKLKEWLPQSNFIIRCMPNIPCSIGKGVVTFYSNDQLGYKTMMDIFTPNMVVEVVSDNEVDTSTLITGCGPAFIAWYTKYLKLVANGILDPNILDSMMAQTLIGTGQLLRNSSDSDIINAVASPNGVTESALLEFQKNNIDIHIYNSLKKAQNRVDTIASRL